jgi:Cu/Zn superoxide dismutase
MSFLSRALRLIVTLASIAALCLTFVTASPAQAQTQSTTERTLFTVLTGSQEVPPESGDPNGIGAAALHVTSAGQVDYALAVAHLAGDILSVHVHNAPRGQRGADVFDLENPVNGFISGTVQIDPADATAIIANPQNYYVEVHTTAFPTGAIRGQLQAVK